MEQHIYSFAEGTGKMKDRLGGKGANLAEMTELGLPVPPGLTITTDVCNLYYQNDEQLPNSIVETIKEYLADLETKAGKEFGQPANPLLVSVRSGAAESMPGMMDTILNLGLNDQVVKGLAKAVGSERFAYDSYCRLINMFGEVVYKISGSEFEAIWNRKKEKRGSQNQLKAEDLKQIAEEYKQLIKQKTGVNFPQDPVTQLITAVEAVFASWNNQRAIAYREAQGLNHNLGTAVTIQTMVFGNLDSQSGTGVVFSRNPSTGENELYGEYLLNAQGEDVVGGNRTPQPIANLKDELPEIFTELEKITKKLEAHYQKLQDVEFTIEQGKLYLLQARSGKRTARADIKIAVDLVKEGVITKEEALQRIEPDQLEKLLHPQIDPEAEVEAFAQGLAASPGAAAGKIVFDPDRAQQLGEEGRSVILVRAETTPQDIEAVLAVEGVLTVRGGMTSHAAVVARGVGKPCVAGCEKINLNQAEKKFKAAGREFTAGDYITIDGTQGQVFAGKVARIEPELGAEAEQLLKWADKYRSMQVMANADQKEEAVKAIEMGAAGIGLCRTEHMFRGEDRRKIVSDLILSEQEEEKQQAAVKMKQLQYQGFKDLFLALDGRPVTIRLLDAPLHEFLPPVEELDKEFTQLPTGESKKKVSKRQAKLQKVREFTEINPMLGMRGCRLGIMREDIYQLQVEAIFRAVQEVFNQGIEIELEIMVPLISHLNEFRRVKEVIEKKAAEVLTESEVDYKVGTMIELPRACVTADQIAQEAEFFSFGTNDLTQTTFGFSREDVESEFLGFYLEEEILTNNPFVELDREGVGRLVEFAARTGKEKNPELQVGICGEQGGNPASIAFCQQVGLDYVSCSPYRIPVARLAAARANLEQTDSQPVKIA